MEYKHFKNSGQIKKVEATNQVAINRLKEKGFVEVEFKNGEMLEVGKVDIKDFDKILKQNEKLKKENTKLKKELEEFKK